MEQLRKDSKSKEKKKSVSKVTITSPVIDMEQLQQQCRVLEYTNEVSMFNVHVLLAMYMYIYVYMYYELENKMCNSFCLCFVVLYT